MKLLLTDYEDYSEVTVQDAIGVNLHVFAFDDRKQATAFCTGWNCCRHTIIGTIQSSIPMDYQRRTIPLKGREETIGQQLSHQRPGSA